jgi:probable HAF family extracellular repeat protein
VNLGSFGGYPTWPTAINNSGEIVGYSHLSDGEFRPFIWHAGTMTDLTTQGVFSDMIPTGINADGVIVGNMNTGGGIILAFLVDHGTVIDLNSLVPGLGCCAFANGINAVGDVVGETNVDGHAVLWTRN